MKKILIHNITFGFFIDILFSFKYERNIYKKDYYLNTTISSIRFKYDKIMTIYHLILLEI